MKQYIETHRERFFDELFSLLRIPSISAKPEHKPDMYRCAERLVGLLKEAGADEAGVYVLTEEGKKLESLEAKLRKLNGEPPAKATRAALMAVTGIGLGLGMILMTFMHPLFSIYTRDEAVMAACPNMRYVGELATGYNNIDVQAARRRGVVVTNIPAYSTMDVVQMTFALLLDICLNAARHSAAVHAGKWAACPDFCFWETPLIELAGKTLGIVGFGQIGRAVARVAVAMGMKVLCTSRHRDGALPEGCRWATPEEIYAESDVISLHCPLNEDSSGMINRDSIARMKDGVILLNTGRGPLIVEQDLADALNAGKVYAAGVDVVSEEPIRADNPLLTARNCVITPHIAWAPTAARQRLMDIAVSNLAAWQGGNPVNNVAK